LNAAELTTHSERVPGVGKEFFHDEPVYLVRDEQVHHHDAARKPRPALVVGREHTDAFATACAETVRELC